MALPLPAPGLDAPAHLEVRLLGQFSVSLDGVVLDAERWPSLRATHLVQLLSLAPRRRLTREEVIDALWPQLDPEVGAANLRKAAHHARQALGRHDAVVLQGREVTLWPGRSVSVDIDAFDLRAPAALASRGPAAEEHLKLGARLHRAIGAATGEACSLQRLAEVTLQQGRPGDARVVLDEALDVARQTDVGFHLLDRIYGTRIQLAGGPAAALHALEDAREAVRGPLETCPGCRITFAVPAAIAAARGGRLDLAEQYEGQTAYLASVVMRLPAWCAAHDEVKGHLALARGEGAQVGAARFAAAAARFLAAGHVIDAARCETLAAGLAPPLKLQG